MDFKNLLGNTVRSSEDPLGADQRTATEILVQRVDQGHLPAPLPGGAVCAPHHASLPPPRVLLALPIGALDPTNVLVGDGVL